MARLNDFAAPSESVEALKRRFVRQNREIARVNSMQSLRIRSLESEVSHLLGENVSLREQVINLTQEIERLESAKLLHDGIYDIKGRLDAKLAELNGLASELGMLPRKAGKLGDKSEAESDHPKATALEPRPRAPDSEYNAGFEDGKLPAILEDKYYPRRTLEPQEIQNLVQADHSLPGSPHELHLDHEQSDIAADVSSPVFSKPLSDRQPETLTEATEPSLPPTLETRKKKKKTDSPGPITESIAQPEVPSPKIEASQSMKSGSKRKFSPDDDGFLSDTAPEDDEFQFSRPSHSPSRQTDPFDFMRQGLSPSKTPVNMKRGSSNSTASRRKVLEPKSANANLGSPKKGRAALHPDNKMLPKTGGDENTKSPVKPKELESNKNKSLSQKPRVRSTPMLQKQKRSSRSTDFDEAVHSQLTSTVLKDSPVARSGEALMGVSDLTGSRPSRRRGAVVSYAEPNLRDKMRRPTSEMADAVIANGSRRSSSFQLRESLDNKADHPRKSGAGPGSASNGNLPADLALADQATDVFVKDNASEHLLETVSRRRQSRRHSSNPKSTTRHVSSRDVDSTGESPTNVAHMDSAEGDEVPGWDSAMDVAYRRETRVAARRKSMMV